MCSPKRSTETGEIMTTHTLWERALADAIYVGSPERPELWLTEAAYQSALAAVFVGQAIVGWWPRNRKANGPYVA